jgi:L-threonylcarbamoyladenylate synthase
MTSPSRSQADLEGRALEPIAIAAHLAAGEAALLPTDTLPALAAVPAAAAHLWERKQRPADKPLILMGADLDQLIALLAVPWRQEWLEQARRHWPGAVTLVLPIGGALTDLLHPGGQSLGLRIPDCPPLRSLLRLCGPLATSSANRSGQPAARTATEAAAQFPDLPLLGPLPWPGCSGQASAVWRWQGEGSGDQPWTVLRPGAIAPPSGRDAMPGPL